MNKQELIGKIKSAETLYLHLIPFIKKKLILDLVKKLDEPQKVQVPQFVADYIKDAKYYEWDLDDVFDHITEESEGSEISEWFYTLGNVDVFARAWLDGYEVEKEKRYLVKMKGVDSRTNYLYYGEGSKTWLFKSKLIDGLFRKNNTRKELEEAGFGWVFDCPGIEIEEVE